MNLTMILLAALSVLPADRLQMADRLFNRGKFAEALEEYESLEGDPEISDDQILYRLAECARATGKNASAMNLYAELVRRFPDSQYAGQSRFLCAMGAKKEERAKLLKSLDTDRIDPSIRAAALYHLGVETKDESVLAKCVEVDPKGRYSSFAKLHRGTILSSSNVLAERRKGVGILLELAFANGELAEESLYLSALQTYRDKSYSEAGSLFRRYCSAYAKGMHADESKTMAVWCDFMQGRYSDAAAACGEAKTDDLAYIKAACAYQNGDNDKALAMFKKYLDDFPEGKYRKDAELPIARIEFDLARKNADGNKTIESAKRSFGMSKLAADALRLAWAYENAEKIEDAVREYDGIAKQHPKSEAAAEAMYRKAMIHIRRENWSAAEMCLAEALATDKCGKFKGEALYWRGVAAIRIDHTAEGANLLNEALATGLSLESQREARLMLADYAIVSDNRDEAVKAYSKLVRDGACDRMSAEKILSVGKMLPPEEAEICAKALIGKDSPEWRQAGHSLLGAAEESKQNFTAAIDAYRKALAEPVKTTEAASAALKLGVLESKEGQYDESDKTLKLAISLNAKDARSRAIAYSMLAENADLRGDVKTACAYATVVTSLFDDEEVCAKAKKILADHPECNQ